MIIYFYLLDVNSPVTINVQNDLIGSGTLACQEGERINEAINGW